MFNRPRCRDWSPLATQQLRLRNLIQISGHNIKCNDKCSVYFTLHMTSMSSPFFTSEKLDTPNNAIWSEINSQKLYEYGTRSVCVRVWEHQNDDSVVDGADKRRTNPTNCNGSPLADRELFLWGVSFSGLINIPNRTTVKFANNTLVFQMCGGYFTSCDQIVNQCDYFAVAENEPMIAVHLSKSPTNSSNRLSFAVKKFTNSYSSNLNCDDNFTKLSRNSSKNSLLSNSPKSNGGVGVVGMENEILTSKLLKMNCDSAPIPSVAAANSSNIIINNKKRYVLKDFLNSEIRPSYDVHKLLKLQDKQHFIKHKRDNSKELNDKICMKSACCLNIDLFNNKTFVYSMKNTHKGSGMGRTLNRLLFQQNEPPDPAVILKAQTLRRNIEIQKFRCRLLTQERDRIKILMRHLDKKLNDVADRNIETESWLMLHYRNLSRENDASLQNRLQFTSAKETLVQLKYTLQQKRLQLLKDIIDIYRIEKSNDEFFTVNGVRLPDAESYTDHVSANDLSVALGYAARIVCLASTILDIPLRNPIVHDGSHTKIVDKIKLSPPNNTFPLYTKESTPPRDLLYGVFLLNQNIAQLKFSLGLSRGDMRATLPNLLQLLTTPAKDISFLRNILVDYNNRQVSNSNSSIDLDCLVIPLEKDLLITNAVAAAAGGSGGIPPNGASAYININSKLLGHRVCRSVGSFSEEKFLSNVKSSSEPYLATRLNLNKTKLIRPNQNHSSNQSNF